MITDLISRNATENRTDATTTTTTLASDFEMIARLLERQVKPPCDTSMHITTTPDLTLTLPTYSGKETESFPE